MSAFDQHSLQDHLGHRVKILRYGQKPDFSLTLVCTDCETVLTEQDSPEPYRLNPLDMLRYQLLQDHRHDGRLHVCENTADTTIIRCTRCNTPVLVREPPQSAQKRHASLKTLLSNYGPVKDTVWIGAFDLRVDTDDAIALSEEIDLVSDSLLAFVILSGGILIIAREDLLL